MSKKLNSVSALFAIIGLVIASSSASAQTSGKATQAPQRTSADITFPGSIPDLSKENRASNGPKAAVVAVTREGRVLLAGDKKKVIGAMQKALNSGSEPGMVNDISIQSFPKASYLAIRIEKQGTLYLQLEPSGGGIQGKFYVGEEKYLYCSSEGCGLCTLNMAGSGSSGPTCDCNGVTPNAGVENGCKLKPRLYVNKLALQFNGELLAIGFEVADDSQGTRQKEDSREIYEQKKSAPGRTDPIKRPNN